MQNLFLQCVCYRSKLLQWMFFVPFDNCRPLFFLKVCRYCEVFSTIILSFCLKQVFWKKSIFYLHSNSAVLILMLSSKIKLLYTILLQNWKTFADFFMIKLFTLFSLWLSHTFLYKWVFLKNSEHLWRHVFT